jgi:hypothetical protein
VNTSSSKSVKNSRELNLDITPICVLEKGVEYASSET